MDYTKFKTPFFKLAVADSKGKNLVELPHQLMRLVERVEILETFDTGCIHGTLNITFIEGSREPYPTGKAVDVTKDTNYAADKVAGLTNQTGLIPDLRYSSGGSITAIAADLAGSVTTALDSLSAINNENDIEETSNNISKASKVSYLFQERNQVLVTWGYLEDKQTIRKLRGQIITLQTEFPEADQPRTTVICQVSSAFLDQLSSPIGVNFGLKFPVGIDTTSLKPIYSNQDLNTKILLEQICAKLGVKSIISDSFIAAKLDGSYSKTMPAGMSATQFFKELASRHNAYLEILPDPETGEDTLIFLNKNEYQKASLLDDSTLFHYKGSGSILKSISIKADFGVPTSAAMVGVNDAGKIVGATATDGKEQIVLYKGEKKIDNNPIGANPSGIAKGFNSGIAKGGTAVGKVEITAESNSKGNMADMARSRATCLDDKAIAIEFTSIGYTKIRPRSMRFYGLGNRYSGVYNIISVTHTLDSSGYTCKGTGTSYTLSGLSGVDVEGSSKGAEATPVTLQLFGSAQGASTLAPLISSSGGIAINAYRKLKEGK